jgi:GNAT superfamily N-acetyltransferase
MDNLIIRPLEEGDLDEADRIMRLAFGTFVGLADPMTMFGDSDMARTRFRGNPEGSLAAELEGRLVGSNFLANWGSVGFFGPLSVDPPLWEKKIARRLLDRTMELFKQWGMRHLGLFTFPQSPKHLALYQKYGFWPRYLTAVMEKKVQPGKLAHNVQLYSTLDAPAQKIALADTREMLSSIYEGLDVTQEIESVTYQKIGETVLLRNGSHIDAIAVGHMGKGSEGGSGTCYIKFGAVRTDGDAEQNFDQLFDACESVAAASGCEGLEAGVNTERHAAYRAMIHRGFRTFLSGVAMQHGNDRGYNRPNLFLLDDWR